MKRTILSCLIFLSAFKLHLSKADCAVPSVTTAGGTYFQQRKLCPNDLIFEETFDTFDLEKWQHEITLSGGGNWEFQYYLNNRTNSYVENGNLHIRPTFLADDAGENYLYSGTLDVNSGAPADECTNPAFYGCSRTGTATNILNPIKSARIRTVDSFYFKYGVVEVRAKTPTGDWLWPAIWMLPRYNSYGSWPASGEIDILESRGNKKCMDSKGMNIGSEQALATLHWGPEFYTNQYIRTQWAKQNSAGFDTDFHTYKIVWHPNGMEIFVDNELTGRVAPPEGGFYELGNLASTGEYNPWKAGSKMAPFDQKFYLIINLAVGGTGGFFPEDVTNSGGKPWSNTSPRAMTDFWEGRSQWQPTWNLGTDDTHLIVDYVRVYAF